MYDKAIHHTSLLIIVIVLQHSVSVVNAPIYYLIAIGSSHLLVISLSFHVSYLIVLSTTHAQLSTHTMSYISAERTSERARHCKKSSGLAPMRHRHPRDWHPIRVTSFYRTQRQLTIEHFVDYRENRFYYWTLECLNFVLNNRPAGAGGHSKRRYGGINQMQ